MCGSDDVSTTLPHFSDPRSIVSRVSNSLITSRVSAFTGGAHRDSTCTPGTGDADICHAAARDDDGGGGGGEENLRTAAARAAEAARRREGRGSIEGSCRSMRRAAVKSSTRMVDRCTLA
jgi:hypothetical protein